MCVRCKEKDYQRGSQRTDFHGDEAHICVEGWMFEYGSWVVT